MKVYSQIVRLYLEISFENNKNFKIIEKQAHYLLNVMRIRVGSRIFVFNGFEGEFIAEVVQIQNHTVECKLLEKTRHQQDEEELQLCDKTIGEIADKLEPKTYTSREFIREIGKYLKSNAKKKGSLIETAYDNNVPIFCPAFTDSSAGFGLVMHQERNPKNHITMDSIREFRELTEIKIKSKGSGLFMIGGGVPKNFIQDTVICAELLGKEVDMHKYAIQITVADSRDGACSSSTLKEASSWGKVDTTKEQMVFAEATSVLPLIASNAYHAGEWKNRERKNFSKIF